MPYKPSQKRVAKRIYRIGRKRGESRKEILAALETGLVEANLGNPRGGSGTSSGWRQETASSYPNVNRRDVPASIRRFYDETSRADPRKYGTAGQLAQAVQRSAYPARYDERKGQAKDLLKYLGSGAAGSVPARGGARGRPGKVRRTVTKTPGVDNSDLRKQLKLSYLQDRDDPGALLELASGLKGAGDVAPVRRVRVKRTPGVPGRAPSGKKGTAVPMSPPGSYKRAGRLVEKEVLPIAQRLGIDVTPASVKASNASHGPTVSGGRSDHQGPFNDVWAADMSNGQQPTKQMDLLARRIAKKFGIPWSGAGAVSHTANGYRYQLIYRSNVGGNHFNHVHLGVRKA